MTWIIESPTRGTYVGAEYSHHGRPRNWPLFSQRPNPDNAVRFTDRAEAEAEFARVQSFAANARLREVG